MYVPLEIRGRAVLKDVFHPLQSSWMLAAYELGYYPFDTEVFQAILRCMPNKGSGLDIALNYAFSRFFKEEINYATAKIMGGMPQYRRALTKTM